MHLLIALPNRKRLYFVPYPSVFLLWWASWIPASFRPTFIADAYISIWDSAFNDRTQASGMRRLTSAILRSYERRAFRAAGAVVVDTTANRSWMVEEFGLEPRKVHSLPLAFDAGPFLKIPELDDVDYEQDHFTVLFFGTLVPLQGIQIICQAIERLKEYQQIRFQIVGDGQESWRVEQLVAKSDISTLRWIRDWSTPAELAGQLSSAHLSLGVFGGAGKAERVLPWKIYLSLAAGRPVLTQSSYSLPDGMDRPPLLHSKSTAESLASAILSASRRGGELSKYAKASRQYFLENLGEPSLKRRWNELLKSALANRK